MALFQPTFVIPSTRTEGTVDVSDNMEIKWQVNGQSAMIAFKIDFFRNDWASTHVTTTGKQPVDGGGFRGIDRFGKVKFYTYDRQESWNSFHPLFINGMQYKMQITQYYIDNPYEYYVRTSAVIDTETACYFSVPTKNDSAQIDYYLSFTLPEGKYPMGTKIAYNISSENGYVIKNNAPEFLTMTKSTTKPTDGTDLGISTNEESVVQRSMDVFRTFTKPKMALYKTNEDFLWQDGVGEELLSPRNLSITTTMDLGAGTNNYFSFIQNETRTMYASFTALNAISANTTIFYNAETKQGYYELNGEQVNLTITESTTQPVGANNIGKAYIDLATSIGYFHTNYMQEQGKPIRWVEWQVATASNGVVGDIIADTGKINTQTLDYSYNGFFNGQQYAIRCYGYSESEQYCDTGWIIFNVNIKAQGEYTGNFSVQCLPKENATLLQWEGVEVIPPRVSPEGYKPLIANGSVTLAQKNAETSEEYSVTWDKQIVVYNRESKTIPMNFEEPWTAVWKGDASFKNNLINTFYSNDLKVEDGLFSYNGKFFATYLEGELIVYSVNNKEFILIFQKKVSQNNSSGNIIFSPNNRLLVLVHDRVFDIYELNNNVVVYVETNNQFNYNGTYMDFSPNSELFLVNGYQTSSAYSYTQIFSVSNSNFVYSGTVMKDSESVGLQRFCFSPIENLIYDVRLEFQDETYALCIDIYTINNVSITFLKKVLISNYNYLQFNLLMRKPTITSNGKYLFLSFRATEDLSGYDILVFEISDDNFIFKFNLPNPPNVLAVYPHKIKISDDNNTIAVLMSAKNEGYFLGMYYFFNDNYYYLKRLNPKTKGNSINFFDFNDYNNLLIFSSNDNHGDIEATMLYDFEMKSNGVLNELSLNNLNKLKLIKQGIPLHLTYNDEIITEALYAESFDNAIAIIQSNKAILNFYNNNQLVEKKVVEINLPQEPITSISINGGDNGIKVDCVSVFKGDGDDIIQLYDDNPNFEPVWNSDNYQLYMTANFNGNLEGGTGTSTGSGFRVYRREYNSNVLFPIATVPSTTLQVKDFGLRSGKLYEYYLYVYDSNDSFMTNVEGNQRVTTKYNSYSLMVCDYDSDNDEYHVRKQYLFINNATEGAMSNNNTPTINKNFTSYPTIMNSTSNYVSGTLSSLIGVIYTVPALIEQIGTYKFVKKPSTLDYFDSVDLQKELFQLSTLPYQLFLRDLKGNMRMVKITAPISMTVNTKQTQLSTTISIQWTEIDNADDVTVIQTPDDYGWNNDNQLLDVKLNVDTSTGELYAQYPRQYRGTKFTLVGANKEILQANTPIGITPANITLSNVAEQTTDGQLNATIKVNKE